MAKRSPTPLSPQVERVCDKSTSTWSFVEARGGGIFIARHHEINITVVKSHSPLLGFGLPVLKKEIAMTFQLWKVMPVAALFLTALCPSLKANLITNGGFGATTSDTQTPAGWTNIGPADGVIANSTFSTPSYMGFASYFDLGGFGDALPASGDGIEQTVTTSVGTIYKLSFGLSNENAPGFGPEFLNVLVNGTEIQSYAMTLNSSFPSFELPWVTEMLDFTATSPSSVIAFTVTGTNPGGQDPLIAGVDLEANSTSPSTVPEPGTVVTFCTGMLAMMGFHLIRIPNRSGVIRNSSRYPFRF
jgi:hypothetical protein